MNQSSRHFYVYVEKLNEAQVFFKDCLGMNVEFKTENEILASNQNTNIFLSEKKLQNQTNRVVLTTDDCLEDYCKLKAKGIKFNKAPVYLNEGLCAEFCDASGNVYSLLERRNYSDY